MIKLKDGSIVDDIRLDRLEEFDERSKEYPISELFSSHKKKFRSYTWRCNENFDQGHFGSCVSHGFAHELAARPAEVKGLTPEYIKNMYWNAQRIDPWEGGSYPGANPKYEGTSVLAGAKVYQKEGWFDEYRWSFTFDDFCQGIGYHGPAVIGVRWYEGMFRPDDNGFIHPSGRVRGGHCVLVRAINIKEQYFTIKNSWGTNWGINGDCYISFDDMNRLMNERGESLFCLKRHRKQKKRQISKINK